MNGKDIQALTESYKAVGNLLTEEMYDCLRDGLSYAECCRMYPEECAEDGRSAKAGVEEDGDFLRDVLGYEPEDFEHEDPDQAAMDRSDRPSGDEAFNHLAETLESLGDQIRWAGFDEENEIHINNVVVKVVGFSPGE